VTGFRRVLFRSRLTHSNDLQRGEVQPIKKEHDLRCANEHQTPKLGVSSSNLFGSKRLSHAAAKQEATHPSSSPALLFLSFTPRPSPLSRKITPATSRTLLEASTVRSFNVSPRFSRATGQAIPRSALENPPTEPKDLHGLWPNGSEKPGS
jgi:hypothetical protein